jgi:hypothetical protein
MLLPQLVLQLDKEELESQFLKIILQGLSLSKAIWQNNQLIKED